jgi:hypothetical protein
LDGEVDSDAIFPLSEDELSVNTGSPRPSPTVGPLLAEHSPHWEDLHHSIRDDIIGVVDQEGMKDEIKNIIKQKVAAKRNMNNIGIWKTSQLWGYCEQREDE